MGTQFQGAQVFCNGKLKNKLHCQ